MALLMLLGAVGCNNETKDPEDTTESTSDSEEITTGPEADAQTYVIASNGETEFTIWLDRDLYSSSDIKNRITDIITSIKKKTGAELKMKTDNSATEADFAKPGILIGPTVFPESQAATAGARNQDYYVGFSGNKVLLYGNGEEGNLNALNYFYNKVIAGQKIENKTLKIDTSLSFQSSKKYGIESVVCCGTELKEYTIVIPKTPTVNETHMAYNLAYHLSQHYGYHFEVVADNKGATDYEILVGNTSRTTATAADNKFTIAAKDGKLQFVATDMRGYEAMFEYMKGTFFKSGSGAKYTIEDDYSYTADAPTSLTDGTILTTTSYGDVRVMIYNVYGYSGDMGGPDIRQPLQREIIADYNPDIFGAQEYSSAYHSNFTPLLKKLGYTEIQTSAGSLNCTPLFYKADKYELIESGWHLYTLENNGNSKSFTWGAFKEKATGKQFIIFSTHFMYNQEGLADPDAVRQQNAREISAKMLELKEKYPNTPIMMGGDLNSNPNSNPHRIMKDAGLVAAHELAPHKNLNNGYHAYPTYNHALKIYTQYVSVTGTTKNHAIDMAYVLPGTTVKTFVSLTHLYPLWTSDHMPFIVELELK